MKAKKKKIYADNQNIFSNPFKYIPEISMRNMGVKTYDFNKLKSTRSISLNLFKTGKSNKY